MKKIYTIFIFLLMITFVVGCNEDSETKEEGQNDINDVVLDWLKGDNQFDMDAYNYISNNAFSSSSDFKIHFNEIDWNNLPKDDFHWSNYRERKTKDIICIVKNEDTMELLIEYEQQSYKMVGHIKIVNDKIEDIETAEDYEDYLNDLELSDITYFISGDVNYNLSDKTKKEVSEKVFDRLTNYGYDNSITKNSDIVKKYKDAKLVDSIIGNYSVTLSAKGDSNIPCPSSFTCWLILELNGEKEIVTINVAESSIPENDAVNYVEFLAVFETLKDHKGNHIEYNSSNDAIFMIMARTKYLIEKIENNDSKLTIKDNDNSISDYPTKKFQKLVIDKSYAEDIYGLNIFDNQTTISTTSGVSLFLVLSDNKLNIENDSDLLTYDEEKFANVFIYSNDNHKIDDKYTYYIMIEHTNRKLDVTFNSSLDGYEIYEINYSKEHIKYNSYVMCSNILKNDKLWYISETLTAEEYHKIY